MKSIRFCLLAVLFLVFSASVYAENRNINAQRQGTIVVNPNNNSGKISMTNKPLDNNVNRPLDPLEKNVNRPPDPLERNVNRPPDPLEKSANTTQKSLGTRMPVDPLENNANLPDDPLDANINIK